MGLGTQDDLELARDFVAKGGITFTMLWDESFESWQALGVAATLDADRASLVRPVLERVLGIG